MKKILIVLACLFPFLIVSCGVSGTSKKAVEEGKIAIVSKEYEKAKDLFQLAVKEDSKNTIAKDLLDLCNNYIVLLDIIETSNYEIVDELISSIELNKELEIIKDSYQETKKQVLENKEMTLKYREQITVIENLLNDGSIDEAKSQATAKLEEVAGYKALENRLNNVINKVNGIIDDAKNEILQYHLGEEIIYKGLKDSSYNGYNIVSSLEGKVLLYFKENQQYGSPKEYMYDRESGNIYSLNQGRYLLVNNNNEVVYEVKEPTSNKTNATSSIKISSEESRNIARNYFLSKNPSTSADELFVSMGDDINENNEYYRSICGYVDDAKTIQGKVIAEYYVNATTGAVRDLWD